MINYKKASEILKEQFNELRNVIQKALEYISEHFESGILSEMRTIAEEIFDCFEIEYEELKNNDSYYIISEEKPSLLSALTEYWKEAMEMHNIEMA